MGPVMRRVSKTSMQHLRSNLEAFIVKMHSGKNISLQIKYEGMLTRVVTA